MSLQVQQIGVRDDDQVLLHDISFELADEHLVVFGANGSGKTMLTSIISGNLIPSTGSITIDDQELQGDKLWQLKKHIGLVSPKLFEDYDDEDIVIDVVLSGLFGAIGVMHDSSKQNHEVVKGFIKKAATENHPEAGEKVFKLLTQFDIADLAQHRLHTLSYGEQMRVLIARALMINPRLLILDEPTSGLDLKGRAEFMKLLQSLETSCQLIYITHHLEELLPSMQHILMLKEGRLHRFGPLSEHLNSDTVSDCLDHPVSIQEHQGQYRVSYF